MAETKLQATKKVDIVIPVMGATGAGKSFFINTLLKDQKMEVGRGLKSCTRELGFGCINAIEEYPALKNYRIVLVDTPGFDDTYETDFAILETIANWLKESYEKGSKLGGVIYLHDISAARFTGTARRNLQMFRNLCGEDVLDNVVLGTTKWVLEVPDSEMRHDQLVNDYWKTLVDKGARTCRFKDNSFKSAWTLIDALISPRATTDLVIPVIGAIGAGTLFMKTLLKQQETKNHQMRSVGQESSTSELSISCNTFNGDPALKDYRIVLVDIPGFDDTHGTDFAMAESIATRLKDFHKAGARLGGVIYLPDTKTPRSSVTISQKLEMFRSVCGEDVLNLNDVVSPHCAFQTPGFEGRSSQLVHRLVLKIENRLKRRAQTPCLQDNSYEYASSLINTVLANWVKKSRYQIVLQIQKELVDKKMIIPETQAGQELRYTLQEVLEIHKKLQRMDTYGDEELQAQRQEAEEKVKHLGSQIKNLKIPLSRQLLTFLGF